ncbi:hypothetical protein AX15_003075 [Amanita polypyramis BW_CC]|nr:hypothetical protein AX15_003075 [Amanita polypyramis BW_CC]
MVFCWFIPLCIGLLFAGYTSSFPINITIFDNPTTEPSPSISSMSAPHFVVYSDAWAGPSPPSPSSIKGFNVLFVSCLSVIQILIRCSNLAFLLLEGPWDNARAWADLSPAERSTIKSRYAEAGIKILVSAFGSTDTPTTSGADPVTTANECANWVKDYGLDGIDVDYEDFAAFEEGDGKAEDWLITFTKTLRSQLPQEKYIITHAPVAPWFERDRWGGGGYLKVDSVVGHLIDWYNVQFYNQGVGEYITCHSLLEASSDIWPNTAIFQIAANGVPMSKIVIGKPATAASASSGYMDPGTLASCLSQAKGKGWTAGAMAWQYPDADTAWITAVRSQSWSVA